MKSWSPLKTFGFLAIFLALSLTTAFKLHKQAFAVIPDIKPTEEGRKLRDDLLENSLGEQLNATLELEGPNMANWLANGVQYNILAGQVLLAGPGTLVGDPQIGGVLGHLALSTGTIIHNQPNLKTYAYLKKTVSDNILSPEPAYAQGQAGSDLFKVVQNFWQVFRNIAYALSTVFLIIIGFMIMFRYKSDPRTEVAISAALPRLIMALLLITFSYTISGLIIDLARAFKYIIDIAVLEPTLGPKLQNVPVEPFKLIKNIQNDYVPLSALQLVRGDFFGMLKSNIYLGGTGISASLISLVLTIIAIIVCFILFFTLVFRYASVVVQVIFSPLVFLWGSLPGQQETINWFKSMFVNVFSFPIIYLMVNISNYIAQITKGVDANIPPPADLGWTSWLEKATLGMERDVGGLIAFGILVAATRIPATLEDILEVEKAPGARGGVDPTRIAQKIPIIGDFF